jgi:probable phosphoglycerate mutase
LSSSAARRRASSRGASRGGDRCLVSPLVRAQETARLLVEGRDIPLETHACLAEGSYGALDGLERGVELERHREFFRLGRTVLPRLAATGLTAPGGETRADFAARAKAAQVLVSGPLFDPTARALVVSHGGLLHYLIQLLLGHEPRDDVTIGFEFCGVARVTAYREEPSFGPFAMLHFASS